MKIEVQLEVTVAVEAHRWRNGQVEIESAQLNGSDVWDLLTKEQQDEAQELANDKAADFDPRAEEADAREYDRTAVIVDEVMP